jgi:hypothetical protein
VKVGIVLSKIVVVATLLGFGFFEILGQIAESSKSDVISLPPPQPIPFSHRIHVKLGLKCLDCHPIREPGLAAGFPKEAVCMACHGSNKKQSAAIAKLSEYARKKESIPWVKIYRVPDNVFFSHKVHYKDAGITCDTCHGPVADRHVIVKERPTSMTECMKCHDKSGASNDCGLCHS